MNVPAEPALAPEGDTYVMTGTSDAKISDTISRVGSSMPPGVSSSIRIPETLVEDLASPIMRLRWEAVDGCIAPLISVLYMNFGSISEANAVPMICIVSTTMEDKTAIRRVRNILLRKRVPSWASITFCDSISLCRTVS